MNAEKNITILVILHIAMGSIFAFVAIIAFIFMAGIGAVSGDPTAFAILGFIGTVGFLFLFALGLPGIIGGFGLMRYRPWARILVIALSCLNLFAFPIGTALAIYAFYVLMNDDVIARFEGRPPVVQGPPPNTAPPHS